jgi:hypothetical protein
MSALVEKINFRLPLQIAAALLLSLAPAMVLAGNAAGSGAQCLCSAQSQHCRLWDARLQGAGVQLRSQKKIAGTGSQLPTRAC